jgi:hypothetical protein
MPSPNPENPVLAKRADLDADLAQELSRVEALKKDFDVELSKSEKSGNYKRTLELKNQIDENLATLNTRASAVQAYRESKRLKTIQPELPEQQFEMTKEFTLSIGAKNVAQYRQEIANQGYKIGDLASDLLLHPDFNKSQPTEREKIHLARLTVSEIATNAGTTFTEALKKGYLTTTELFKAAKTAGLELAPASVGPELRLAYKDQPLDDWISIGMQPLSDRDRQLPAVLSVSRDSNDVWLGATWAAPEDHWSSERSLVFSLSKWRFIE